MRCERVDPAGSVSRRTAARMSELMAKRMAVAGTVALMKLFAVLTIGRRFSTLSSPSARPIIAL